MIRLFFLNYEKKKKILFQNMTAELLRRSSCNVITIDWQLGANLPYTQAVANIRVVGVMTAHLINRMVHEVVNLKSERIHIIGHSLGAHLASYVGTALRRTFGMRLGRISGKITPCSVSTTLESKLCSYLKRLITI